MSTLTIFHHFYKLYIFRSLITHCAQCNFILSMVCSGCSYYTTIVQIVQAPPYQPFLPPLQSFVMYE